MFGKRDVMIDQEHERCGAASELKLQTRRDRLREKRARFGVRPRADAFARVVEQQREIEDKGIFQLARRVPDTARVSDPRLEQRVEFLDADQRVLVRGVAMKKLVLHQAGELPKLRKIASRENRPRASSEARARLRLCGERMRWKISRGALA